MIYYYCKATRIADNIGPPNGLWDNVDGLRCTSVGRHVLSMPERQLEILFENPRTFAAWNAMMAARGSLRMDTCKYWIALIRYSWPNAHGEGGIAQTIKDIPLQHI